MNAKHIVYSPFGCPLEVLGNANHVIHTRRLSDGKLRDYFLWELRADGGLKAVFEAITEANPTGPEIVEPPDFFAPAMRQKARPTQTASSIPAEPSFSHSPRGSAKGSRRVKSA
jgi:hypothetical protein